MELQINYTILMCVKKHLIIPQTIGRVLGLPDHEVLHIDSFFLQHSVDLATMVVQPATLRRWSLPERNVGRCRRLETRLPWPQAHWLQCY